MLKYRRGINDLVTGHNDSLIFRRLVNVVFGNGISEIDDELIRLARLNKVLLHVLRAAGYEGELRREQEDGLRRIIGIVAEVEDALRGFDHAFIKLIKPVTYVPADVDVLVRRDQVLLAASRLVKLGYRVLLYEPYTITLVKDGINVDLYIHPSAANLVYARGEDFLRLRVVSRYHGVEVDAVDRNGEVVLTILHAIYKEGILTLNDAVTILSWLNEDAMELCKKLRCMHALEFALNVMSMAIRGSLVLPYKLPIIAWAFGLLNRTLANRWYAPSVLQGVKRIGDARSIAQIINRIMRISY